MTRDISIAKANLRHKKEFKEWLGENTFGVEYDSAMIELAFACREYALREALAVKPTYLEKEGAPESPSVWLIDGRNQGIEEWEENIENLI